MSLGADNLVSRPTKHVYTSMLQTTVVKPVSV